MGRRPATDENNSKGPNFTVFPFRLLMGSVTTFDERWVLH
jgi:hypothetical protein